MEEVGRTFELWVYLSTFDHDRCEEAISPHVAQAMAKNKLRPKRDSSINEFAESCMEYGQQKTEQ